MKNVKTYFLGVAFSLLIFYSCRSELPNPLQLELTLRVVDEQGEPVEQAYAYFSLDETAAEIAAKVDSLGLGYSDALLRPTSSQGMLSLYPIIDFPGIEENTEIHFYIRSPLNGSAVNSTHNLNTKRSFILKKLKAKAHDIEIVLE
ncbi:MAG: hypothetical protein SF052_22255 [Bacteroidia bacterium]|nr:hypothetical protein [Bacteroidia bacterium]